MNEVLCHLPRHLPPAGPEAEALARRGIVWLRSNNCERGVLDLESARGAQARAGDRLLLVDTLTYLALAYARNGNLDRALATSDEALQLLGEMNYANMQPQRVFWHHYQILEMLGQEPRLPYLQRAVEFIDAQASTLSRAQQRRLRQDVPLNREILATLERHAGAAVRPRTDTALPHLAPTSPSTVAASPGLTPQPAPGPGAAA